MTIGQIAAPIRNALVGGPFGSNLVSRDYTESGVPVIRGQNMGGRWVSGDFAFVSPAKAAALTANLARPGDLVLTQRGTLGQVALVPPSPFEAYVVSQSQMKLTVDPAQADPLFVYYAFRSASQQAYIRQNAIQVGVPHTNLGILRETPVELPPLAEQREIAHILGALDDRIELNRRTSETLEATARALFQSWFVDFDPVRAKVAGHETQLPPHVAAVFPSVLVETEVGEVPLGWSSVPIGELADISGGGTPSTQESAYWNGAHAWATPKDLAALDTPVLLSTERQITDAGLARISSGLLPRGTVLLSSRAPIGYLAVAEIPVAVNQGFIALRAKDGVSNLFLLLWARSSHDTIVSRANGSTFLEISKSKFRPILVVRPTDDVMEAFDIAVRPLYERIVRNERESRALTIVRDTLLPRLLSGELSLMSPTAA